MPVSATHEDFSRDELRPASNRAFGVVIAAALAIIGLLPLRKGIAPRLWVLAVSAAFLAVALIAPAALTFLNRMWTRLAWLLNRIVSPVVTGVLFYGVFTPAALLLRLRHEDLLALHRDLDTPSYWRQRQPPGPAPESMIRQF